MVTANNIDTRGSEYRLFYDFDAMQPGMTISGEMDEESSFVIDKNNVNEAIIELKRAQVNMPINLSMKFQGEVSNLYLKQGFTFFFPDYMVVNSDDSRVDVKVENGRTELILKEDLQIRKNSVLSIPVVVTEMDFEKLAAQDMGLLERGHMYIEGNVQSAGTVYVKSEEVKSDHQVDITLTTNIDIKRIEINRILAVVDPDIDIPTVPIQITNLPDFLDDDEVEAYLTDPMAYITVSNNTPLAINLVAQLCPVKNGEVMYDRLVQIGSNTEADRQIIVPANVTDYVICIHRLEETAGIEADAFLTVPEMDKLAEHIPDEVRIESMDATAIQEFVEMDMGYTYQLVTDYRLEASLAFEEGTRVVYSRQMNGWGGDLDNYDFKEVVVNMKATNGIPLDMDLEADAIDAEGNVLSGVTATVEGRISAGTPDRKTVSELKITLNSNCTEELHRLDGLKYRVDAKTTSAVAGIILNENQTLRLDDIRIQLKGGVTIDMN